MPKVRKHPFEPVISPDPAVVPAPKSARTPESLIAEAKVKWATFIVWLTASWRRLPHYLAHRITHMPLVVRWVVGAVGLVVAAVVLFLAQSNWDWARATVASVIAARTHRPVRIDGHLSVHLFSWTPTAALGGLKIGEPSQNITNAPLQDLAAVNNISIKLELMPLFIGRIVVPRLEIDRPVVTLYQDGEGRANWDFSNGADKGKPVKLPPIKTFIVQDGQLTMISVQRHLTFKGTVNARETASSGQQAFALTGQGSLNNKIFQMNATGGALLNVRSNVPYPFDMDVRAGDTRITTKGRVLHPFNLGQLDATMTLSGDTMADLYYLTGLTLPNTPRYSLAAQISRDNMVYAISGINGRVGSSDLEGTMTVDTRNHGRPDVTADLDSRVLDFKDLGSLFGATAANTPHKAKLAMTPQAPQAANRLLPDAPLDGERIRSMDGILHYRALSVRATPNLPLRQVRLSARLDRGLLTLDPIDFSFPQGRLTGTAKIDARTDTQHDAVDMRLTGVRLQDFVPKMNGAPPLEGVLDARVRASGTGNSVHKAAASANGELTLVMPAGTIRQSVAELMGIDATKGLFLLLAKDAHQTDVRCAIADFRIQNGVMQAQSIIFDTDVVLVNGSGSVNLNDESLKLSLKGQPKKFRLVKINAPILIGGHMSSPTFGINTGPAIAQGGLAIALGSVSGALLALPFVNVGGTPDANCSSLMAEARTQGAPTTTHAPTVTHAAHK